MTQVDGEAQAIFEEFNSIMRTLEQTNNRRVIDMWMEDMKELQTKAHELLTNQFIHPIQLNRLKIICSRTPSEWRVMAQAKKAPQHQII